MNAGIYAGYQGIQARYTDGSWLRSNGVKFGAYGTAQCQGFSQYENFTQWWSNLNLPQWEDNFYINAIIGGELKFCALDSLNDGIPKYVY